MSVKPLLCGIMLCALSLNAYGSGPWKSDLNFDAGFSQTTFDNWSSGGENSNSWHGKLHGSFTKPFTSTTWQQKVKLAYGRLDQAGEDRKTDDELRYESVWTFSKYPSWKPFFSFDLLTQVDEGFDYSVSDEDAISFFFDPAYLTGSFGASNRFFNKLDLRVGAAYKQTLADRTTIVKEDSEFGGELALDYTDVWFDDFKVKSDVKFFFASANLDETDVIANFSISTQLTKHVHWIYEYSLLYNSDVTKDLQNKQSNRLGLRIDII